MDDLIRKKPPIGIELRYSRDSRRVEEILSAMERYAEDGFVIPSAWIAELKELIDKSAEIIRCKKCKHWRSSDHTCHEHSLVSPMMANDFCSRAERREE